MTRSLVIGCLLVACPVLGGCDVNAPETDDPTRGFDWPKASVLGASITTSYDAGGRPVRSALTEGGASAVEDVPLSASLVVRFSRFMLPTKVNRQALCIRPSTDNVDSADQCAAPGAPFEAVEYDPVTRSAIFRLVEGARLDADTLYRVSVFFTEDIAQGGFFAFDGASLDRKYVFDFRTAADDTTAVTERLPTRDNYCAAVTCFAACMGDAACRAACQQQCVEPSCVQDGDLTAGSPSFLFESCAFGNCHAANSPTAMDPDETVIAMGLDLYTPSGLDLTAIGKTAHQTQQGEASNVADQNPDRFGRAMPIVDPNNPGNSYVLYKLLANPLNHRRTSSGRLADADGNEEPSLALEIDRLRASVVVGLPMPAQAGPGGAPTGFFSPDAPLPNGDPVGERSLARLRLIEMWIAHGAATSCPMP